MITVLHNFDAKLQENNFLRFLELTFSTNKKQKNYTESIAKLFRQKV